MPPPAAPAAAPQIELRVPAGVQVEPEYLAGLRGIKGISAEHAQAVLDLHLSQRAAAAQAAEAANAALKASWDAALAPDFPGPKFAAANDAITAFIRSRMPDAADHLIGKGLMRWPPMFKFLAAAAAAAAESGQIRPANAPAPAASADPNDWSSVFTHPTSKAALAAEMR